jgi:hypothetical protein
MKEPKSRKASLPNLQPLLQHLLPNFQSNPKTSTPNLFPRYQTTLDSISNEFMKLFTTLSAI